MSLPNPRARLRLLLTPVLLVQIVCLGSLLPVGLRGVAYGLGFTGVAGLLEGSVRRTVAGPFVDWGRSLGGWWGQDHVGRRFALFVPPSPERWVTGAGLVRSLDGFVMDVPARLWIPPERGGFLRTAALLQICVVTVVFAPIWPVMVQISPLDLALQGLTTVVVVAGAARAARLVRRPPTRVELRGRVLRVGTRKMELFEDTEVVLSDGRLVLDRAGERIVLAGQMGALTTIARLLDGDVERLQTGPVPEALEKLGRGGPRFIEAKL